MIIVLDGQQQLYSQKGISGIMTTDDVKGDEKDYKGKDVLLSLKYL